MAQRAERAPWRRGLLLVAQLLAVGLAGSAAVMLLARWWWVGECAIHWHRHLLLLCPLPLLLLRGWWWAPVLASAAVFAGPLLVPRPSPPEAPAAAVTPLRVASANVQWANSRMADAHVALAALELELLAVVELTPELDRRLRSDWPHRHAVVGAGHGAFGSGLYSRLPIVARRRHEVGRTTVLDSVVATGAGPLRVLVVHPPPPIRALRFAQRQALFELVAAVGARSEMPLVVLGDFNCSPASPAWPRMLHAGGLRHAAEVPHTWPAWLPGLAGIAIDHVLAGPGLQVDGLTTFGIPGSDHRGLVATVRPTTARE